MNSQKFSEAQYVTSLATYNNYIPVRIAAKRSLRLSGSGSGAGLGALNLTLCRMLALTPPAADDGGGGGSPPADGGGGVSW